MKKTLTIGLIGNVLEWYDFSLYIYFATIIAKLFFSDADPQTAMIATFGIFASGFLMRPIGGILFGWIGDRLGRKKALFLSILTITLPTFLIGCLPTYSYWGLFAPIALTLLRLFQGLSVGGEYTSSILFMTEHAPENRKGFAGSFALLGAGSGWLLGTLAASLTTTFLTEEQVLSFGWRLPFLAGAVTGLYAMIVRRQTEETREFLELERKQLLAKQPIRETATTQKANLLLVLGLNLLPTVAGYLLFAYLPTFLHRHVGFELSTALRINTFALIFNLSLIPLCGFLSDRFGRAKLLLIGALGFVLLSIPLFQMLSGGQPASIVIALGLFTVFISLYHAPLPAVMSELFPPRLRASGVALGYNFAVSLFAGTCPLVSSLLIDWSGSTLAPAYYLTAVGLGSLFSTLFLFKK